MSELSSSRKAGPLARLREVLLHQHVETGRLSAAVGVGVFIGLTPFYGFHTLLALALAGLLRLNLTATLLATQISNPLFAPLVIAASAWLGDRVGGPPLPADGLWWDPTHARFYASWLRGGLALGLGLGALCAALTHVAVSRVRKRRHGSIE